MPTKPKPKRPRGNYKSPVNRLFYACAGRKGGCNYEGEATLKSNIKVKC